MPDGQVLEFTHVTKRFNDVTAVSDFSARVEPGVVTAFLGPNGAGKTTTLRILLGQVRATSGTATIGGVAHPELRHPLRTIGSVLEETAYRPRRSAARQLTIAAKANGIPLSRVDEVLSLVGLEHEAEGRIGSFSLGMRQRLSVAHALLGDPGALVFDEPANGLDPEGIRWIRLLLRRLADEGRTVLVSSHVLSEIEQVADHVLVLSKGQLVLSSGIETLADPSAGSVVVDAEDRAALTAALSAAGLEVEVLRSGLTVRGSNAGAVGAIAASAGIALATLVQRGPTLEDVFIDLVRGGRLATQAITAAPATEPEAPTAVATAPLAAVAAAPDAQDASEPEASDTVTADSDASESVVSDPDGTDADASDAEDAADVASDAAQPGGDESSRDDDSTGESTEHETPAEDHPQPSFDDILFGTAPVDASADSDVPPATESGAAEHSGVEFFSEAQDSEEPSDSSDDVAAPSDDDPRSAAVTSMLAAAARAYYEDEPKDYPLGDADAPADAQPASDVVGEHHENHEDEHHDGEHHDGEHDRS